MSAHTPGPWVWRDGRLIAPGRLPLIHMSGDFEANVCLTEADTALIAAAPELLVALKDAAETARNYYMLFHDETWKERLSKWDAAIARAEGR